MLRARWLLLVLPITLVGCMTYTPPTPSPAASAQSDAQAKEFAPPQGKGNIYIARPGELTIFGQPTPYAVTVDGRQAGGIQPGMYYCIAIEPGNHALSAASKEGVSNTTVRVEAGKNYFFQLTVTDSTKRLDLSWVILEPMGKLMINSDKRAQSAIE